MKHKKVLFEQLIEEKELENAPIKKNKKILIYNFLMSFIYGFFKVTITIIICIIGTFAITILFTALFQNTPPIEVLNDIILKVKEVY